MVAPEEEDAAENLKIENRTIPASQSRNQKPQIGPVQSAISDFGFEVQESSDFKISVHFRRIDLPGFGQSDDRVASQPVRHLHSSRTVKGGVMERVIDVF